MRLVNIYSPIERKTKQVPWPSLLPDVVVFRPESRPVAQKVLRAPSLSVHTSREASGGLAWRSAAQPVVKSSVGRCWGRVTICQVPGAGPQLMGMPSFNSCNDLVK